MENGQSVENVYKVDSLESVIDPFVDYEKYIALAKEAELKIIVSNTTEAGICFNEKDKIDGFDGITYPAYYIFNGSTGINMSLSFGKLNEITGEEYKGEKYFLRNQQYFCLT